MSAKQDPEHVIGLVYVRLRQPWMKSDTGWIYNLMAVALILLAGLINYDARDSQWQEWQANKTVFFADGSPLVSTTDAGYFLSYARDYQEGKFDFNQSRSWPDHAEEPSEVDGALDIPLLSVIIRHLADVKYNGDLLMAGNAMIPLTAFLTAIAIGLCFWVAGFPAEGAIAGLGAGLSHAYFVRTSIGRIDTDQLILFFISLILGAILLACRQTDWRRGIFFILLAAGLFHLFHWWYDQGLFVLIFPLIVFLATLFSRLSFKSALIYTGIFILFINPLSFASAVEPQIFGFLDRIGLYSVNLVETSVLAFPDPYETIIELSDINFFKMLVNIFGSPWIGLAGLVSFGIWAVIFPVQATVFLPFLTIGLFSNIIGQRFAFYAAPILWFGFGWMILSLLRILRQILRQNTQNDENYTTKSLASYLPVIGIGLATILLAAMLQLDIAYHRGLKSPNPSFPAQVVEGFTKLGAYDNGRGGVIASWWDYGYLGHFKSGLPTLHDPGNQRSPRAYIIGRGFVDKNPNMLINGLRFIAQEGNKGIKSNSSSLTLFEAAISSRPDNPPDKPIYIVVTEKMGGWLYSMARNGLHDLERNQAPSTDLMNEHGYYRLRCIQSSEHILECGDKTFNLLNGTVDNEPVLARLVQTENGFGRQNRDYGRPGWHTVLLEKVDNRETRLFLIPNRHWISTFNQLYRLGLYDRNRLELIIDQYPDFRVYEVLR
ncbi:hypothetical protein AB8880_12025 [Alphaproteobacteria bacterium LSUCC0684]